MYVLDGSHHGIGCLTDSINIAFIVLIFIMKLAAVTCKLALAGFGVNIYIYIYLHIDVGGHPRPNPAPPVPLYTIYNIIICLYIRISMTRFVFKPMNIYVCMYVCMYVKHACIRMSM